ncbi:hypothetical protein C8Q79DRAFT_1008693 [Trametes meyenii]|nr:hypothetical protein C8Q79DRAFT_1008693 [Trametes meyenii]
MAPTRVVLQCISSNGLIRFTESPKKKESAKKAYKVAQINAKQGSSKQASDDSKLKDSKLVHPRRKGWVPAPCPILPNVMQDIDAWARKHVAPEKRDEAIGEAIVKTFKPDNTGNASSGIPFFEETIVNHCIEENMLRFPSPGHKHGVLAYKPSGTPSDCKRFPTVFLNHNTNALFSNRISPAASGFAYILAPECARLFELDRFHLYNNPPEPVQRVEYGQKIAYPRYHYAGVYRAHKLPFTLSRQGWQALPEEAKMTAAQIYSHTPEGPGSPGETLARFQQLASGAEPISLVLFECLEYSSRYYSHVKRLPMPLIAATGPPDTRRIPPRAEFDRKTAEEERRKQMQRQRQARLASVLSPDVRKALS